MIVASYNYGFVVASILIAMATAYCSLEVAPRIPHHEGWNKGLWTALASFCLGGGIWSMHFVAMLAFQPHMPVTYDLEITGISLALPILTAGVGFTTIHRFETLTWPRAFVVGIIFGISIVIMHYTGMAAMRTDASMVWNYWLVAVSFLIACVASIAALKTTFTQPTGWTKAIGAVLLGAAISGMHYTGMAALTLMHDGNTKPGMLNPTGLGTTVALVATTILGLSVMAATYDKER